jgi:diguanylate cyclase (GGDEF)-like protein
MTARLTMRLPARLDRWLRSARTWIVLGVLAPIGMLVISGLMLLDLRNDAWATATQTSRNLLQVIERDVARNMEIIDLSLRAVIDNLSAPGIAEISPELRQLVLFDRAATATDMGVMLVVDEHGDTIIESNAMPARTLNNADRDYFQAHAKRADLGLVISRPIVSRLLGVPVVVLSRRIDKPDGSFGGVVSASLKLSYFSRLFENIALGTSGAINLYLSDGTRLMRHPSVEADIGANIAGAPTFERFRRDGSGLFVGDSVRDGVRRLYAFTGVGTLPLILNVALATHEIEAEWRTKALVIGLTVLALCGLTISLSLLFGRELRQRALMQVELSRLSLTDALTGLPNRRRFEAEMARAWNGPSDPARPRALLVIDADHFKAVNDRHGHSVGDTVLIGLARCLTASVHRPDDLVCRVGGEEFVMLLPETDEAGARRIADKVHAEVAKLAVVPAGIRPGAITVSIGLASTGPWASDSAGPSDLYRHADAALYEAKAAGRNQTRSAPRGSEATGHEAGWHPIGAT